MPVSRPLISRPVHDFLNPPWGDYGLVPAVFIMCGIWVSGLEFQVLAIVTTCVESFSLGVNAAQTLRL